MDKIVDISDYKDTIVQELICVKCLRRFINTRPSDLWLKECECPGCGEAGYLIATGQPLDEGE